MKTILCVFGLCGALVGSAQAAPRWLLLERTTGAWTNTVPDRVKVVSWDQAGARRAYVWNKLPKPTNFPAIVSMEEPGVIAYDFTSATDGQGRVWAQIASGTTPLRAGLQANYTNTVLQLCVLAGETNAHGGMLTPAQINHVYAQIAGSTNKLAADRLRSELWGTVLQLQMLDEAEATEKRPLWWRRMVRGRIAP